MWSWTLDAQLDSYTALITFFVKFIISLLLVIIKFLITDSILVVNSSQITLNIKRISQKVVQNDQTLRKKVICPKH